MKRFILTATLAWLLAACAQPGTQAPAGAADPHAAVPATRYQPAIDAQAAPAATGKTATPHEHHAGMDMQGMQGMQCMADGKCSCCAGKDKAGAHAGHARMAMGDGCCCGYGAKSGQPAACKAGGTCGCCNHKEAM